MKLGWGSLVGPVGPPSIATVGGSVSTVKSRVWVVVSGKSSVARTRNVQSPSASGPSVWLLAVVQGPKSSMPWSTEHSMVVAFSTVNPNVGDDSLVGPSGPLSIVTVGAANAGAAFRQASSAATTAIRSTILGVPTPLLTLASVLPQTCQPGPRPCVLRAPPNRSGWATGCPPVAGLPGLVSSEPQRIDLPPDLFSE